jgi:hypothetical protein
MMCASFSGLSGVCVRKSPCFRELLRYDVRAGRSFIIGGYSRVIPDPITEECIEDPEQSRVLSRRVPVGPAVYPVVVGPRCAGSAGAISPVDVPDPNPCFDRQVRGYEGLLDRGAATDVLVVEPAPSTVVRYANPDLAFALGVSHLARLPRGGVSPVPAAEGPVFPMPERGMTIEIETSSGFVPLRPNTASALSLPRTMLAAPDGFVYIVDTGDLAGATGSRGQVLRLNAAAVELDNFTVR